MTEKELQQEEQLVDEKEIIVDPGQSMIRLDKFLMDKLDRVSRSKLQDAIKAGAVLVNDKTIKPSFKVKPGDKINLVLPRAPKGAYQVKPQNIPLDIRYEDDDLIVLHKPAGLVVHPGVGNYDGTLVNGLLYYLQNKALPVLEGNSPDRPGLVHRIDKDTSGLMVVAKNDYAMAHLANQFFHHTVERKYVALIWGEPDEATGTITGNIGRNPKNHRRYMVFPEGEAGKHAVTHYKLLEGMYYVSVVECQLETGRTHQIRVHMRHIGHPLFGDAKYGGDKVVKGTVFSKYKQFVNNCFSMLPRHALHAKVLGFVHPTTGEKMHFEADMPDDLKAVIDKWRSYLNAKGNS